MRSFGDAYERGEEAVAGRVNLASLEHVPEVSVEPEADGDADGVPAFGGVQKGHEQLMTMGVLLLSGNILHHTRPRRLKVPVCAVCGKQLKHLQVAPVVTAGDLKSDPIRARVVRVHTWWGWLGSAPRTRSARTAFGCPLKHANNNRS